MRPDFDNYDYRVALAMIGLALLVWVAVEIYR